MTQGYFPGNPEIDRVLALLDRKISRLEAEVDRLKAADTDDREWMKISDAVKHPKLKGRLTAKQIRDRIARSLEDPISSPFIINVHYQIVPGNGDRNHYTVNIANISQLLAS